MLQSARPSIPFAVLVVLILILHVAVFANPNSYQEPAASSSDKKSTAQTTSPSKKRKKKKTTTVLPLVVFSPSAAPTSSATAVAPVAPVTMESVQVVPSAPTRGAVKASKTSGVHVSPSLVPTPLVASAGQLVISEFRVRGPNGLNDEFIEIANVSGADHTVAALSGGGYGIAASDGTNSMHYSERHRHSKQGTLSLCE